MKLLMDVLLPVLMLAAVMGISTMLRNSQATWKLYSTLNRNIKSKKLMLSILTLILGVIPIPGRIMLTCGVLSSLAKKDEDNSKMGILAYLASHHYYLWSPMEKSIIIVCSIMGITYGTFMGYMWLPAVIGIVLAALYIFFGIKESEIRMPRAVETPDKMDIGAWVTFIGLIAALAGMAFDGVTGGVLPLVAYLIILCGIDSSNISRIWKEMDWKMLAGLAAVIVFGAIVGDFAKTLTTFTTSFASKEMEIGAWAILLAVGFMSAFILGSSAKYAAIVGILLKIVGIKYLPLLYLVEYAGYLLSPAHKCVYIGNMYFRTPMGEYWKVLSAMAVLMILVGIALGILA